MNGADPGCRRHGLEFTATNEGELMHQLRQIFQTPFLRGSGRNGRSVLHSDLLDTRLRRSLLEASPLRDEASAALVEGGHYAVASVFATSFTQGTASQQSYSPFLRISPFHTANFASRLIGRWYKAVDG